MNLGTVWGAGVLGAVLGRRDKLIALSAYGIPLINAVMHIGGAIREQAYNPGLLSALVLFIPVSLWAVVVGYRQGIGRGGIAAIVVGGVLCHVVLIVSLLAYLQGLVGLATLLGVQILNAFAPLAAVLTQRHFWPTGGLKESTAH